MKHLPGMVLGDDLTLEVYAVEAKETLDGHQNRGMASTRKSPKSDAAIRACLAPDDKVTPLRRPMSDETLQDKP